MPVGPRLLVGEPRCSEGLRRELIQPDADRPDNLIERAAREVVHQDTPVGQFAD